MSLVAAMEPIPEEREPHHNAASFLFIDQPWVDQAVCAQTDPEAFFPEKGGQTREAKAVCATCFVQAECLDWALTTNERFGVWGGLSERERRAINNEATCPQCDKTFTNPSNRDRHLILRHNPANLHVCDQCGQTFPYPGALNRHAAAARCKAAKAKAAS